MELERWRFTNVYSNEGALGGVDEADFTWWVFFARFMNGTRSRFLDQSLASLRVWLLLCLSTRAPSQAVATVGALRDLAVL